VHPADYPAGGIYRSREAATPGRAHSLTQPPLVRRISVRRRVFKR